MNAGVGLSGRFVDNDLQTELKIIQLNCASIVHLSKLIIPEMLNNKHGKILFTSFFAAEVAKDGFEAIMSGKDSVVAGSFKNKLKAAVARILPEETQAKVHTSDTKPDSIQ